MSRYDMYKKQALDLLQNKRMKLFAILLIFQLLSSLLTLITPSLAMIISFVVLVANLVIYTLFLNLVRGEPIGFSSISLTFSKVLAIILVSFLSLLASVGLMFVTALLLQWLPALYTIGAFFVTLLMMMVQVIAAFAINDGETGIWRIFSNSVRFVRYFAKEMFQSAGVYILVALSLLVVSNLLTAQFMSVIGDSIKEMNAILETGSVLTYALAHEKTLMIGYGIIVLQAVQIVWYSYLFTYIYTMYALFYNDAKDNFFVSNKQTNVIYHGKPQ